MSLDLYHGLASTCSKKVRMTLYEKGVAFNSHLLNLQKFEQHDPAYLELNPAGVVPTLVDAGTPITESSIIIEYIDDRFTDTPLSPSDPVLRAKMRHWLRFSDNVAYDAVYLVTWAQMSAKAAKALDPDALDNMLARVPTQARKNRWAKVAGEGFSDAEHAEAMDKMTTLLKKLNDGLADGPWLIGDFFSLADIANVPFVDRVRNLYPELLDPDLYPNLTAWEARLRERPSFDQAFQFRDGPRVSELPNC